MPRFLNADKFNRALCADKTANLNVDFKRKSRKTIKFAVNLKHKIALSLVLNRKFKASVSTRPDFLSTL